MLNMLLSLCSETCLRVLMVLCHYGNCRASSDSSSSPVLHMNQILRYIYLSLSLVYISILLDDQLLT
jgi:hypothetical protein